jgi:hypothetical protein
VAVLFDGKPLVPGPVGDGFSVTVCYGKQDTAEANHSWVASLVTNIILYCLPITSCWLYTPSDKVGEENASAVETIGRLQFNVQGHMRKMFH